MQSGNTAGSSPYTPGEFSGSSSSCEYFSVRGILSDKKKPPRRRKKVCFDEASLVTRKRKISHTSLKWQAYIQEQFKTLRAHRKRNSKSENDCHVYQKKIQTIPRSKNMSKRQESNGSAHLSGVNMFELPKTGIRTQEAPERRDMQNGDCFTTNQKAQGTAFEGGKHDAGTKVAKPKRPLNAFFVFIQYCRKEHILDGIGTPKQVCQVMGCVWRYMSRDERYVFYVHAERLRVEYYRQKGEWEKSRAQFAAGRKRALNGYTLFCREHFSLVRFKMSRAHPCLVVMRLARMWRRLRRAQKLAYKRKARVASQAAIPNLTAIIPTYVPTYVCPKVFADVPRDKPDYVSSEVPVDVPKDEPSYVHGDLPANVTKYEPDDIASKVSSGEPAEYSDYRSADPSVAESATIDAPVNESSTTDIIVDASSTIDTRVEISSTMDAPADISDTVYAPVNVSSTTDITVDASSTIDTRVENSSTMDVPADIPEPIDAPANISEPIDAPADISEPIDAPADISDTIDAPADISDTIAAPVDVSNTVEPGPVPSITENATDEEALNGNTKELLDASEICEIEETIDNPEKETLSSTVDSDAELPERKPSDSDTQDGNNSEKSGGLSLGTNCNNTWSDVSDCDGKPSHNLSSKMNISPDDDDDAMSRSSRTSAMTSSPCTGSSLQTLTSVSRDNVVNARTFLSTCKINSNPARAANVFAEPVPQSSSHPLPTCSTNQEYTIRRKRILKARARRLKRRPRRARKINLEMPEKTAENLDFDLTTVSEKSSTEDYSLTKTRSSMHDYLSAMSDDELPVKILRDSKLKRYLLELKALKHKYKPTYNVALLRSNTVMDAISELDLYFATAEASMDSEDSLTSVLSSDSEEILYPMQSKVKGAPSDKDLAFVDDLSSNSSDSLSFCFFSSHLLVTPSDSSMEQQVFTARGEASIKLTTSVNNEPSTSYLLNASGKNDKGKVQLLGDKSLNHTQKLSLIYSPMKDKKTSSENCAYLRHSDQSNTLYKYPCTQAAAFQTSPCSVIQDELCFSSSEATYSAVPKTQHLTGQVQDRKIMTCRQPSPKANKQRLGSCPWGRDETRQDFTERLSLADESSRASCLLKCKDESSFTHLRGLQQASKVPMAEKVEGRSTQASVGVPTCRKVSVSSRIQHGEGKADQNKCESWKKSFDQDILRLSAKLQLVSLAEQSSISDLDTMKSTASSPSLKSSGIVTEEDSSALESTSESAARVRLSYHGAEGASSKRNSRSLCRDIRSQTVAARSDIRSRSARSHRCSVDDRLFEDDDRDICSMVMDDERVLETPADYPSYLALRKRKRRI